MRKAHSALRNLRRTRTISQAEFARIIGISQQTLSKFERGILTPSPDMQALLAVVLGTSRHELFPGVEQQVAS